MSSAPFDQEESSGVESAGTAPTLSIEAAPARASWVSSPLPWWGLSAVLHGQLVVLIGLIAIAVQRGDPDERVVLVSMFEAARDATAAEKSGLEVLKVLASCHDTPPSDPKASVASDIVVPPEILAQAELGDHFETIQPDRPDTQSAFGSPDASMFHSAISAHDAAGGGGALGLELGEMLGAGPGAGPGTGGGWGGGHGTGVGIGNGSGQGSFGQRNGGGRRLMVMRHGGSRASEGGRPKAAAPLEIRKAEPGAEAALRWLSANQAPDGRWDCSGYGGRRNDTAVTGLAVLAFLGAGHTEKIGAHRETVRRAVEWLRTQQGTDGKLGAAKDEGRAYAHALAGLALTQAAGMSKNPETMRAAQRAVDWSCTPRDGSGLPAGSWRYDGGAVDGDLSASGWFVMQLRSAQVAGLRVPPESFARAWEFLDRVAAPVEQEAGAFLYRYRPGSGTNARLDAIGHACRQMLGAKSAELEAGVRRFVDRNKRPGESKVDLHYWYFGTLCAFQQGGETWKTWNGAMKRALLARQHPGGILGGSWNPEGPYSEHWGRVGQTALGALMLEVYYRYLPLCAEAPVKAGPPSGGTQAPVNTKNPAEAPKELPGTEEYAHIPEKDFVRVTGEDALSTFAVDVDTASYSNVRRILNEGGRVPKGAVRVEELVNYFDYAYEPPQDEAFAVHTEMAACPWNPEHRLALVALKGKEIPWEKRPPCNLVFLVDVSGSMSGPNRLPLVQKSLRLLASRLDGKDRVAVVVYAGAEGLALDSTTCDRKEVILKTLDRLSAGGSTNGGAGISLAYRIAETNLIQGAVNRVILCTDGDFNVGVTSQGDLVDLIQRKAKGGVFLTVLGFGMGNYKDATLEMLADKGNGNYGYIDNEREAQKLLVRQAGGTLVTVAKDVKVQVEFNPARAAAYRLIGYENRLLAAREFRDDAKDAGEIGAGHAVTALYEIIPAGDSDAEALPGAAPMKYQKERETNQAAENDELFTVCLRHKAPEAERATERQVAVLDRELDWRKAGSNFRWAAAVALFGMELRGSGNRGEGGFALVQELAASAKGGDPFGYRAEFLELLAKARKLHASKQGEPAQATEEDF